MLLILILIISSTTIVTGDEVIMPSIQFKGSPLFVPYDFPVAASLDGKYIATASKTPGCAVLIDTKSGAEVMELKGGKSPITSIRFTPDDHTLLGGDDRRVYMWRLKSRSLVATCPANDESPGSTKLMQFAIAGNGNRFVTAISRHVQGEGSKGVTYQSWNLDSGAEEWSRHLPEPPYQLRYLMNVSYDGTVLAHWPGITSSQNGSTTIHFWKIVPRVGGIQKELEQDRSLNIKEISPVQCVAFTPSGKELIVTGSRNLRATGPNKLAQSSPDKDPLLLVYRSDSLQESARWNTRMSMPMSQLVFNRDGSLVAGFDSNWYELGIWETSSGKSLGIAKRDPYKTISWPKIWELRFNQKNQLQCSYSNIQAGKCIFQPRQDGGLLEFPAPGPPAIRPHSAYINTVAFSRDQKQLLTYDGGMLCTWDLKNLELVKSKRVGPAIRKFNMKRGGLLSPGGWASLRPIISSDGMLLVTQGLNAHLILTRLQSNEEIQLNLDLVEKQGMELALRVGITPDGKRVVAEWTEFLGYDQNPQKSGKVEAWDTANGNRLWSQPVLQLAPDEMRPFRNNIVNEPLSISTDSKSVVISGGILDVATGQLQSDWTAPIPQIRNGFLDSTGKRLVNLEGNQFGFWDMQTGRLLERWVLPDVSDSRLINILPDGRTALVSVKSPCSTDVAGSIILWIELASQQVRARFAFEHHFPFAVIGVSPDGNTLIGTNKSNAFAIWKLRTLPRQNRLVSKPEMEQHWKKICGLSADGGWKAMQALAEDPNQTIPFVMEHLNQRPTSEQVNAWIEELGHSDFNRREKAFENLAALGKSVEEKLKKASKSDSLEWQRRAEKLLQAFQGVDLGHIRDVRAVELLEMIGNAEAKKMLSQLAGGNSQDWLTQEAQIAIKRLTLRK
ncbi:MAG: WD40 repeat domain-containing protein [Planctomycetia bacterium]|nr:WD40 repeat domain-containing protein [Planctomycetia bacterium]